MNENKKYTIISFISLIIIWIIISEILFPLNKILPRPTHIFISIEALIKDYNFLINFLTTTGTISFAFFISFLLAQKSLKVVSEKNPFYSILSSIGIFIQFIPGLLWGCFLIIWFPFSTITPFLFISLSIYFYLIHQAEKINIKNYSHYVDSAVTLGLNKNNFENILLIKSASPYLFEKLNKQQTNFWLLILIYEYINNFYGIGVILRRAIQYNDFGALFYLLILTGLIIFIFTKVIEKLNSKIFFWGKV